MAWRNRLAIRSATITVAECHRGTVVSGSIRTKNAIRCCRENVALVLRKIPAGNRDQVARAASFEDGAVGLVEFARTLPSAS